MVRMFVILGHEDKPIKIYGPELSSSEKFEVLKKKRANRKILEAKKAARKDINHGCQTSMREFFSRKGSKGK